MKGRNMSANPYVQGWREWDERYADLVLGKRNWQIAAGCSTTIGLVLAVGVVWLALRSRYVPYVVVTDRLGQAMTIPDAAHAGRRHTQPALLQLVGDAHSTQAGSLIALSTTACSISGATRFLSTGLRREISRGAASPPLS